MLHIGALLYYVLYAHVLIHYVNAASLYCFLGGKVLVIL
jgi:hypothetical protein